MKILATAFITFLSACAHADEPVHVDPFQGLVDIRLHSVQPDIGNTRYEIMVALPDSYADSPDTQYPTIYVTDGAGLFPMLRSYYRYLKFAEEVPEMIFVAISYSGSDWTNESDRSHDYSAPSSEREDYGGAVDFQAMLRDEVLPLVEKTYRARPDRRIIFGQSMGGQFVMYTAHTDPGLFWGHIASNPAMHRNLEFFLPGQTEIPPQPLTGLVVVSASDDAPSFKEPAMQWIAAWSDAAKKPWRLQVEYPEGHNHFSPAPVSFRLGMKWLFSSANIPRPAGD